MNRFRAAIAVLVVCFVAGFALATMAPQTVMALNDDPWYDPNDCNLDCYLGFCDPEVGCPLMCPTCVQYYRIYQHASVVGCDGPYTCGFELTHCAVTCETHHQ